MSKLNYIVDWNPQRLEQWKRRSSFLGRIRYIAERILKISVTVSVVSFFIFASSSAVPNTSSIFALISLVLIAGCATGVLEWQISNSSYRTYKGLKAHNYQYIHSRLWKATYNPSVKRLASGLISISLLLTTVVIIVRLRPYVYENNIADLGVTGVLPNFLTAFGASYLSLTRKDILLGKFVSDIFAIFLGLVCYEVIQIGHLFRTFDPWDILATALGVLTTLGIAKAFYFPKHQFSKLTIEDTSKLVQESDIWAYPVVKAPNGENYIDRLTQIVVYFTLGRLSREEVEELMKKDRAMLPHISSYIKSFLEHGQGDIYNQGRSSYLYKFRMSLINAKFGKPQFLFTILFTMLSFFKSFRLIFVFSLILMVMLIFSMAQVDLLGFVFVVWLGLLAVMYYLPSFAKILYNYFKKEDLCNLAHLYTIHFYIQDMIMAINIIDFSFKVFEPMTAGYVPDFSIRILIPKEKVAEVTTMLV